MPGGYEMKFKVLTMDPPPITACPDLLGLCLNACLLSCVLPQASLLSLGLCTCGSLCLASNSFFLSFYLNLR